MSEEYKDDLDDEIVHKEEDLSDSDEELDSLEDIFQRLSLSATSSTPLTEKQRQFLESPVPQPLETPDLAGVAKLIKEGKAKNIIVMTGAGISVSAGIPDFRTPPSGLYYNLQKYNLEDPQDVFSISYFRKNPKPFYEVVKGIYPDQFHPTKTHYFIKLLAKHGLLLRLFTQNIDTLEFIADIPQDKVVYSHGSFSQAHCSKCHTEYSYEYVREKVFADEIVQCKCGGYIKPDIVFFGEDLPPEFFQRRGEDFPKCDLLIIMGTSLVVHPFADLISYVPESVPRLLINLEVVSSKHAPPGDDASERERFNYRKNTFFAFEDPKNRRDALYKGPCDIAVQELADALGWGKELQEMYDAPVTFRVPKKEK